MEARRKRQEEQFMKELEEDEELAKKSVHPEGARIDLDRFH